MEEILDKIKDGASKAKDGAGRFAKEVAKHTTKVITKTKLAYLINEANSKIKDIYTKIGEDIYENRLNPDNLDFADEFEQIDRLKQDIEELNEKKAELKNSVRCNECGEYSSKNAEYCSKCGAPIGVDEEVAQPASDDEEEEEVITITPEMSE